jgi:hypothetical protein
LINAIFFTEKNANVQFICKLCSKSSLISEDSPAMSLDDLISNSENELDSLQTELNHNINKENLKNLASNMMSDYLIKTICDLLEQKKDILASFLESQDFINIIEKYRKSLENILKSKDCSIKYLQSNSAILKITLKDMMIHNILNIKNLDNDDFLSQKIKNFNQNFQKEFNKNKLYLHGILSTITSDIIYQANIALFNSLRECLRDDLSLIDKLVNVDTYNSMISNSNINNFQHNHLQSGYLFKQMQIKKMLKNVEINDEESNDISISYPQNNLISESLVASVIGLKIEFHPNSNKLKTVLEKQFNCKASLIEIDTDYYGVQLYFRSSEVLDYFMNKKSHTFRLDDKVVRLNKKPNKPGNRFYVKYN